MSFLKHRKWWVLFVTTSGTSVVYLDNTVMPVALATIERDLSFSQVGLVWIVNAYLLSLTAFLLAGGRICDILGKRTTFILGLVTFGLGSWIAGLSTGHLDLIVGRIIQGLGGALTIPATGSLLVATFGEKERAKAIGMNAGISSVFLILGPAIGGFLTEYLSWRSIFYINIPIVIFGIITATAILPKEERKKESFHYGGALMMVLGTCCLVIGLMEGNEWGWHSPAILSLLFAAPLFYILFSWVSTRAAHPLVEFHFFKRRNFSIANILLFLSQTILMATVLWAIYFQDSLHYSAAKAGLMLFMASAPVFIMAPLGGFLSDRVGPKLPIILGFSALVIGLTLLLITTGTSEMSHLLPGLLAFGMGPPLLMPPAMAVLYKNSNPEKLGAIASISNKTRQLAATMGIALLTALHQAVLYRTNAPTAAFFAITLFSAICALLGFLIALILLPSFKSQD